MTISPELLAAYLHHRSIAPTPRVLPTCTATVAYRCARRDVASGIKRYAESPWRKPYGAVCWQPSDPKHAYVEKPESAGLRHVGNVEVESYGGRDCWSTRDSCGWFTDPQCDTFKDGTGLLWGVVYQLPARNGKARFVAGYQVGGYDEGPTLDFSTIYESDEHDSYERAQGNPAARKAAYAADEMARRAAEEERHYQTAYQAGSLYSSKGEEVETVRRDVLKLLKEFRTARTALAGNAFEALCSAIRDKVTELLDTIRTAREERASGDFDGLEFWSHDARLREAFNEGASESVI